MATRPTDDLEWALLDQVDPTSGQNNVVEPPAAWKNYGWSYQEKPPRNYDNWFKRTACLWAGYLDEAIGRACTLKVAASDASAESKAHADYVCDGDDDHIDINNAIGALPSAGGLVLLSEGTFNIESTITLDSKVHIRGMGRDATVIKVDAVITDFSIIAGSSKTDISISHLTIDGSSGSVTENHKGIALSSCSYVTIFDVEIKDVSTDTSAGQAIELAASNYVFVERCYIVNSGTVGIYADNSSFNCFITNCIVTNAGTYGIHVYGPRNTIADTEVRDNTSVGLLCDGGYNKIIGVEAYGNGTHGIQLAGDYNLVEGCMVSGNDYNGIDLSAAEHNLVKGNLVEGNSQDTSDTYDGISVDGSSENNAILGNLVRQGTDTNKQKYGIDLASVTNKNMVQGNDFRSGGVTASYNDGGGATWLMNGKYVSDDSGGTTHSAIVFTSQNLT